MYLAGLQFRHHPGATTHANGPTVSINLPLDWCGDNVDDAHVVHVVARLGDAYPGWLDGLPSLDFVLPGQALALVATYWARGLLNSRRGVVLDAGATRATATVLHLWVGTHVPKLSANALALGLNAVRLDGMDALACNRLVAQVGTLLDQCGTLHPDYIARVLMIGAADTGIPFAPSPFGNRTWQYGLGRRSRCFLEATPLDDSLTGTRIARNKLLTHDLLPRLGFAMPRQVQAETAEQALSAAQQLGWPLVVKPADRGKGKGVAVGIRDSEGLRRAFSEARAQRTAGDRATTGAR
ncbi:hypothetical protein [Thermomonas carbonis]|uniref:ATP-grasp domain-containing protein n=1 Tax=Thermomonas carbonis TaxID=1463158 RepID=A0A7G9SQ67_9GAMM|nr:hypothetical protein [Thermomonas carbonis]QNN69992.1 hypothetical protein H9L16_15380 [Thermomonas carbonis]GHB96885.1 hypothetical protein GCM10010080_06100 [Thermomonas carbonis]